jgi:hypothetical protein
MATSVPTLATIDSASTNLPWFPKPDAKITSYKQETEELLKLYNEKYGQWVTKESTLADRITALADTWKATSPGNVSQIQYSGMLEAYISWRKIAREEIPSLIKRHVQVLNNRKPIALPETMINFLNKINPVSIQHLIKSAKKAFDSDIAMIQDHHKKLVDLNDKVSVALRTLKESLSPFVSLYGGYSLTDKILYPLDSCWYVEAAIQNKISELSIQEEKKDELL